jgi:DNA-binding MarR family transcriptional regulator
MSKARNRSSLVSAHSQHKPLVGGLLRVTYQMARQRQLKALIDEGFDDLNQALLNVMIYPFPNGVHPSDLAARTNMTKQAMNHLLGKLETLGYIKRRADKRRSSTLVFLTRQGLQAVKTVREATSLVEAEWVKILGQKRFNEFLDALGQLSSGDSRARAGAAR